MLLMTIQFIKERVVFFLNQERALFCGVSVELVK